MKLTGSEFETSRPLLHINSPPCSLLSAGVQNPMITAPKRDSSRDPVAAHRLPSIAINI